MIFSVPSNPCVFHVPFWSFSRLSYRTVFLLKRLNREPNRLKRNFILIFYYKPLTAPWDGFDRFSSLFLKREPYRTVLIKLPVNRFVLEKRLPYRSEISTVFRFFCNKSWKTVWFFWNGTVRDSIKTVLILDRNGSRFLMNNRKAVIFLVRYGPRSFLKNE